MGLLRRGKGCRVDRWSDAGRPETRFLINGAEMALHGLASSLGFHVTPVLPPYSGEVCVAWGGFSCNTPLRHKLVIEFLVNAATSEVGEPDRARNEQYFSVSSGLIWHCLLQGPAGPGCTSLLEQGRVLRCCRVLRLYVVRIYVMRTGEETLPLPGGFVNLGRAETFVCEKPTRSEGNVPPPSKTLHSARGRYYLPLLVNGK